MKIRRFIMEDWLASYKDDCPFNLGESGMPDITVGELLARCGEAAGTLSGITLKDHDTRGTERLRSAIAASCHGAVPLEHITVTTGTSEALFILFNLLLEDRRAAVVPRPSFQSLYDVPAALGAECRAYRLTDETGFVPDPDEIASLIDDEVGVVVVNTPHNPSGVNVPPDVMAAITAHASRHGATVIADEHYRFLPHDPAAAPLPTFASVDGRVIATGSITKCFGVIGLRVGWIAAPASVIGRVRDFRDYLTHTLSPVSDRLATLALEHAPAFLDPAIATVARNATELTDFCRGTPGLDMVVPDAGVVAFPRFGHDLTGTGLANRLILEEGVFVLPGEAFETQSHVRINLGMKPARFTEALERMGGFLERVGVK